MRFVRAFYILAIMLACSFACGAPYELGTDDNKNLNHQLYFIEDFSEQLEIGQILEDQTEWQHNEDGEFAHGYSDSAWWFKLSIINTSAEPQQRMLELGYAILDFVDIYVVTDGEVVTTYNTGDLRPYKSRPVDSANFVVPLKIDSQQQLDVYYRIKTGSSLQVPIKIWHQDSFYEHESTTNIIHGLYYGAMVIIAAYNFLIFLLLRDRSYLYYVCFVLSSPFFFLSISGQGFRYLWTDQLYWNSVSLLFSLSCLILFGALFTRRFIGLHKVSIALDRLIMAFAVLGGTMLFLSFFIPYKSAILILIPISALACVSDLVAGSVAWYRGVQSARFYVIAWGCFLVATIVMASQKIGLLPKVFVVEYAVQLGSVLEAVLLSFALVERINTERRLRFEAQTETIDTTRRLNVELEKRVEERTFELEQLNRRLEVLSNTDQLTQLFNRRYFEQVFAAEWERCRRYRHSLSVLLIDIDHFKKVNDEYGHPAGDACLVEVSKKMNNMMRCPTDIVARFGGEEFCVLLPETDVDGASVVAERLRSEVSNVNIRAENTDFQVTISVGVSCLIPGDSDRKEEMLSNADKALYLSKSKGRNRVTAYNPDSSVTPIKRNRD